LHAEGKAGKELETRKMPFEYEQVSKEEVEWTASFFGYLDLRASVRRMDKVTE
jgi:hypothetical protein